jgi:hypothetical protein
LIAEQTAKKGTQTVKLAKMQKRVDQAIADHNRRYPGKIRIAWGYRDKEEEEFEAATPVRWRTLRGLLSFDKDFELSMSFCGDPDLPDMLELTTYLEEPKRLPLAARSLYNVLHACQPSVQLCLHPEEINDRAADLAADTSARKSEGGTTAIVHGASETVVEAGAEQIVILGVMTSIPIETVTSRTLSDALMRLSISAGGVKAWLSGEDDYDQWAIDKGD